MKEIENILWALLGVFVQWIIGFGFWLAVTLLPIAFLYWAFRSLI